MNCEILSSYGFYVHDGSIVKKKISINAYLFFKLNYIQFSQFCVTFTLETNNK